MTGVDLEKLAARYDTYGFATSSADYRARWTAIAEALRLKAALDWLWERGDGRYGERWADGTFEVGDGGKLACPTGHGNTLIAAIDALKAKVEPQPAPEPPPHGHVWSLWFPNEQDGDEVFAGHEESSYRRSCYTCLRAEFADALVPAGSERQEWVKPFVGGTLHENASASPPSMPTPGHVCKFTHTSWTGHTVCATCGKSQL